MPKTVEPEPAVRLDPVVRAIQMPRVNRLIAGDVGLGKTIEAGMTVSELIIPHPADDSEAVPERVSESFQLADEARTNEIERDRHRPPAEAAEGDPPSPTPPPGPATSGGRPAPLPVN